MEASASASAQDLKFTPTRGSSGSFAPRSTPAQELLKDSDEMVSAGFVEIGTLQAWKSYNSENAAEKARDKDSSLAAHERARQQLATMAAQRGGDAITEVYAASVVHEGGKNKCVDYRPGRCRWKKFVPG